MLIKLEILRISSSTQAIVDIYSALNPGSFNLTLQGKSVQLFFSRLGAGLSERTN